MCAFRCGCSTCARGSRCSRRNTAARANNPRLYAHTISDEIHDQQRGLKGVARTKLAFVSDRNGVALAGTVENRQVKEIYIADYDGANQRRVTVSRQLNLNPSWSPDARALAYTTYRPNPDIFVSLIYQGVLQNPTKGVGTNYLPVFSPDGKQIAFMSGRDGNPEIYAMNVDGSNLRRLTNHPAGGLDADLVAQWLTDCLHVGSQRQGSDLRDEQRRRLRRATPDRQRVRSRSADLVAAAVQRDRVRGLEPGRDTTSRCSRCRPDRSGS